MGTLKQAKPLVLRPAREDDGPALNRICYPHLEPAEMEQALAISLAQAESNCGVRLVAEMDGGIVGSGQLQSWGKTAEIANLMVVPEYRGRGIGRSLVEALLSEARTLGFSSVEIGVQAENQGAMTLYERAGFRYQRTVQLSLNGKPATFLFLKRKP